MISTLSVRLKPGIACSLRTVSAAKSPSKVLPGTAVEFWNNDLTSLILCSSIDLIVLGASRVPLISIASPLMNVPEVCVRLKIEFEAPAAVAYPDAPLLTPLT